MDTSYLISDVFKSYRNYADTSLSIPGDLGGADDKATVSLKVYILHMDTVIDLNIEHFYNHDTEGNDDLWVPTMGDVITEAIHSCIFKINAAGIRLMVARKVNNYDIICELLNNKYKSYLDRNKNAFKAESTKIVLIKPDSDSNSD
tara:strand:+ start:5536 stop:5973 length:438 start_codon:yes stop_codon:yes gene_type:complete